MFFRKTIQSAVVFVGLCSFAASVVLVCGCPGGALPASALEVSPSSLVFSAVEFAAPPSQTFRISSKQSDPLDWAAVVDADWLDCTPTSGTIDGAPADVSVSVDVTGLTVAQSPYTAHVTVSAPGTSESPRIVEVRLSLTAMDCVELAGAIEADTTLAAPCYLVESSISVRDGATLTIQPGVTLRFGQDNELTVNSAGRLVAVGTPAQPILLTGQEPIRGYWGGLRFYQSNSTENRLEHVTIEYGGGRWDANLLLDGSADEPARVAINSCMIRESETYGFEFDDAVVEEFEGNTVTANTLGAGQVSAVDAGWLDDTGTYSGNDRDVVRVWGSTVSQDTTWPGIDASYLIAGNIGVTDALLTIQPGATLVFEQTNEMTINATGRLAAVGTAGMPILLTGNEPIRGYWGGLRFYQSNSTDNRLAYVTVEYGGSRWDANVLLDGSASTPARVDISHCTLRESEAYGFKFDDAMVEEFESNTVTANTLGAGNVSGNDAGWLQDSGSYSGNDRDVVRVWGSTVSRDVTWPGIDASYLVAGNIGVTDALLTLAPDSTLIFEQSNEMTINASGQLSAVGTDDAPILFTGDESIPGYWGGLRFYQSNSEDNRLAHVTIEYGGGRWEANLLLDGSASSPVLIDVSNCEFRNSSEWGVSYDADVQLNADFADVNTFANNASGAVNVP